jgi:hypothetical protein
MGAQKVCKQEQWRIMNRLTIFKTNGSRGNRTFPMVFYPLSTITP